METLSEDQIKRYTLQFLKAYYKFRPRSGATDTILDLQSELGIIVDGQLRFPQENEPDFTASFEATSRASQEEVLYRLQPLLLFWDSFAVASLMTAGFLTVCYAQSYLTVEQVGLSRLSLILIGVFSLTILVYHLLFHRLNRYRYIYAVEQFKQYHSDEQWIAIGEDVFEHSRDRYLTELKKQCVKNGFGLVEIDPSGVGKLWITPARKTVFGDRRKLMTFLPSGVFSSFSDGLKNIQVGSYWDKLTHSMRMERMQSLLRYRRTYFRQIILASMGVALIGIVLWREVQLALPNYVDETSYIQGLEDRLETLEPEPPFFRRDTTGITSFEPPYTSYSDREIFAIEDQTGEPFIDPETYRLQQRILSDGQGIDRIKLYLSDAREDYTSYDCERLYNFSGKKYIIQDSRHRTFEMAKNRMDVINLSGIQAHAFWLGCFADEDIYIVYLEDIYDTAEEASKMRRIFTPVLRKAVVDDQMPLALKMLVQQ